MTVEIPQFSDGENVKPNNEIPAYDAAPPKTPSDGEAAMNRPFDADYQAWLAEREAAKPVQRPSVKVETNRAQAPSEPTKSEVRTTVVEDDEVPQSYVWLNNGEILLANDEDLPTHAGKGAEMGYWEKDGKVYAIVGVYPKETTIKENAR